MAVTPKSSPKSVTESDIVAKDETVTVPEVESSVVVSLKNPITTTYHLGKKCLVDFIDGKASVHPEVAKLLKDLGHI